MQVWGGGGQCHVCYLVNLMVLKKVWKGKGSSGELLLLQCKWPPRVQLKPKPTNIPGTVASSLVQDLPNIAPLPLTSEGALLTCYAHEIALQHGSISVKQPRVPRFTCIFLQRYPEPSAPQLCVPRAHSSLSCRDSFTVPRGS